MKVTYEVPEHGFAVVSGAHDAAAQDRLVALIRRHAEDFPFVHPTMRNGMPLSVRVTSFGKWGWWADDRGYRYTPTHPINGKPWPHIPEALGLAAVPFIYAADEAYVVDGIRGLGGDTVEASRRIRTQFALEIDTVLVNWYAPDASLGWHVDRTEADLTSPIITMSLGASAIFEIRLDGKAHRVTLHSGDGVVMVGPSRNAEHRIVRLLPPEGPTPLDLFGGPPASPPHDPLGDGTRMSVTWRRTGLTPGGSPCA